MKNPFERPIKHHLIALCSIGFVGLVIYANSLTCGFVFDDSHNITQNPHIRLDEITVEKLSRAGFKSPMRNRPVANISFALNYYWGGYDVRGYHAVNILIHLANGMLVYVLGWLTYARLEGLSTLRAAGGQGFGSGPEGSGAARSWLAWGALFAALVFTAHPIQVQSVTYIVQRMNSMAAMFYLLAILFFIIARSRSSRIGRFLLWTGCLASWVLALGSKEIAITLPAVLLLYDRFFFQGSGENRLRKRLPYMVAGAVMLAGAVYLFLGENPIRQILTAYSLRDFTMGERVLTQFRVILLYLSLVIYPHPSRLNLLHDISISRSFFEPVTTLFCFLAILILMGFSVAAAGKRRLLSFCILWVFIHLAIESSVVGLEMVFEHRLYLPMVGFSLLAGQLLRNTARQRQRTRITWGRLIVALMIVACLGAWTHLRNRAWQNPVTLWTDVVAKSPNNPRAHYNLGSDLARLDRLDEAVRHLEAAVRLNPDYSRAHNNLGLALFKQGKFNGAMHHYAEALRTAPGNAAAHHNLGLALEHAGDRSAAVAHFREALRIKPDFVEAHNSLGITLGEQGSIDRAVYHFETALKIDPGYAGAHLNLGLALEARGDLKSAVEHYLEALRAQPDNPLAYINLGGVMTRQGLLETAAKCFEEAIRIDPNNAGVYNNLGVVQSKQGELEQAGENFIRALRINPGYAEAHNNLGIVLSRQGRMQEAIHHFEAALNIRPDDQETRHNLKTAVERLKPTS